MKSQAFDAADQTRAGVVDPSTTSLAAEAVVAVTTGLVTLGGGPQYYQAASGDVVQAGSGSATVEATAGNVTVTGSSGQLAFIGGTEANSVSGGAAGDLLSGSATDDDVLAAGPGRETIVAGGGYDLISGGTTVGCVIFAGNVQRDVRNDTVGGGAAGGDTIVGGSAGSLV